jgi:plasmid stability protein
MVAAAPATAMARSLTLKNLPDDLYGRLKQAAQQHRRSLNNEAIVCLEAALPPQAITATERLEQIRALRHSLPTEAAFTPEQIDAFKRVKRHPELVLRRHEIWPTLWGFSPGLLTP